MSDKLEVDLSLNDQVSAAAKKAADALKKVDELAAKVNAKLGDKQSKGFANMWSKIGMKAESQAQKQTKAFSDSWSKIGMAAQRAQERAHKAAERAAEKAKENSWLGKGQEELMHKLVGGFAAFELVKGLVEGATKAVEIVTEGVKMAFEAGANQEQLALSYRLMFGKEGGASKMEDQEKFAKETKYSGSQIGRMMLPLYNSGMSDKAARQAFATSGDLEARTGKSIEGFIDLMTHIQSKGGVTGKMLSSQLGIDQKQFFKDLGKNAHMSAAEAEKKASAGKLNPQLILNTITQTVNKAQGGEAGTGAKDLSKTMKGRWDQLTNLPEEYLEKMNKSPEWQKMSDQLGEVFKSLDPNSEKGQKIIAKLFEVFDKIAKLVERFLSPEGIDAFVKGLQGALSIVEKMFNFVNDTVDAVQSIGAHGAALTGDASESQKAILAREKFYNKAAYVATHREEFGSDKAMSVAAKEAGVSPELLQGAAKVFGQGGKGKKEALQLYVTNHVNVHPAKDDTSHTGQAVADVVTKASINATERVRQEMGR